MTKYNSEQLNNNTIQLFPGITDLKNKISPLPSKNIPTYPYILRGEKKGEGVKQKREGVRKREI